MPDFYTDFHWSPPEDEQFTFDLEEAGRLLDEAGYEVGADGLRTMPDGSPIGTLRLIGRPEEKRSIRSMDYLKEWLGEIGIESEVIAMESNALTNTILEGEYDIFHWGWYVEADPDGMLSYMTCGQRGNWSDAWYCNEEYDKLYEQQAVELDDEKRQAMIHEMQQILWEDSPVPRDRLHQDRPGLPQRPLRLLPAAARSRWDPAGAVRPHQLPPRPTRRGGRGLRRGDLGARADPRQRGRLREDEGVSTGVMVAGGVLLLASSVAWRSSRGAAGRPWTTASSTMAIRAIPA